MQHVRSVSTTLPPKPHDFIEDNETTKHLLAAQNERPQINKSTGRPKPGAQVHWIHRFPISSLWTREADFRSRLDHLWFWHLTLGGWDNSSWKLRLITAPESYYFTAQHTHDRNCPERMFFAERSSGLGQSGLTSSSPKQLIDICCWLDKLRAKLCAKVLPSQCSRKRWLC